VQVKNYLQFCGTTLLRFSENDPHLMRLLGEQHSATVKE